MKDRVERLKDRVKWLKDRTGRLKGRVELLSKEHRLGAFPRKRTRSEEVTTGRFLCDGGPPKLGAIGKGGLPEDGEGKLSLVEVKPIVGP